MKTRILFLAFLMGCQLTAKAQWRIGITGGETYNHYTIDTHYMTDLHYKDAWGSVICLDRVLYFGTIGITGQYDFNDWLGVRADLNWTTKGYRQYRTLVSTDFQTMNSYLLLPVMASLNVGGKNIRGFLNLGVYGGYWLMSYRYGTQYSGVSEVSGSWFNDFNTTRDQRFDFGLVSGMGVEWRFHLWEQNWTWQIFEARLYYSTLSTQKDYMIIKDPRYNTTIALQSGLSYFF